MFPFFCWESVLRSLTPGRIELILLPRGRRWSSTRERCATGSSGRLLVARSIFYRGDVTARVAVRICRLAQYPVRATCGRRRCRRRRGYRARRERGRNAVRPHGAEGWRTARRREHTRIRGQSGGDADQEVLERRGRREPCRGNRARRHQRRTQSSEFPAPPSTPLASPPLLAGCCRSGPRTPILRGRGLARGSRLRAGPGFSGGFEHSSSVARLW
jgi:hypothetical protein